MRCNHEIVTLKYGLCVQVERGAELTEELGKMKKAEEESKVEIFSSFIGN